MATLRGTLAYSDDASIYLQPATVAATAAQSIGPRRLIRIVSDQPINVLFGPTSAVPAPTATTGNRIPPNFPIDVETTDGQSWCRFFNTSGSTANICLSFLAKA
jgi:hypothetical protein